MEKLFQDLGKIMGKSQGLTHVHTQTYTFCAQGLEWGFQFPEIFKNLAMDVVPESQRPQEDH